MDYIYTRVSTDGQSAALQLLELKKLYADAKIVEETVSGMKHRPILAALLLSMVAGDRLIIYSLDRLGRRAHQVLTMLEDLKKRGITLISKREGVDYNTMAGKMVTQVFISFAEMERELISERTTAGLAAARAKGSLLGRPTVIPPEIIKRAVDLVQNGYSIPKAAGMVTYMTKERNKKGCRLVGPQPMVEVNLSVSYLRKVMKRKNNQN